jgi:hypothetical protein
MFILKNVTIVSFGEVILLSDAFSMPVDDPAVYLLFFLGELILRWWLIDHEGCPMTERVRLSGYI